MLKSKSPQESNKIKFPRQGLKTQFRFPFAYSWPQARIQKACVFFLETVLSFREKQHFRFTLQPASRLSLASPNWVKNRPFSFDSQVATIECSKIVMQPTYCITFPRPKPTISRILD